MDVHIGEMETTVRAVDAGSLLSPDVLERIVASVVTRLDERTASDARARDDTALWHSVREGTGR
jgi:hypothetical protein